MENSNPAKNLRDQADELYQKKKYIEAASLYKDLLESDTNPLVKLRIGECYLETQQFENAIKYLKLALENFEDMQNKEDKSIIVGKRNTYFMLGKCYKDGLNDYKNAMKMF